MVEAFVDSFLLGVSLLLGFGPQNLFILQCQSGLAARVVAVVVCTMCDTALIAAGMLGIGAWISREPIAMAAGNYLGAAVLLRLTVLTLRSATPRFETHSAPVSVLRHSLMALSVSLLNPAAVLDTVIIMSSFITHIAEPYKPAAALGAVCASALWFTLLAVAGRFLMNHLRRRSSFWLFKMLCALSLGGTGFVMAARATQQVLCLGD